MLSVCYAPKQSEFRLKQRFISEAGADSFVIADSTTGAATAVAYTDVAQVKGHNLSKGAKIAIIGLAIAAGVLAFFLILENTG